jgi:prepilin-type processing-associated H-X9-DG protein
MKQLALALHNYHDAHNTLPPGYLYRPDKSTTPPQNGAGFSWSAMALPFLEQASVYREFDWNKPVWDDANKTARMRQPAVFLCPTDTTSAGNFLEMGPAPEKYAMSSYVACFGPPDLDDNQEQRNGLFSRNSRTRFADATDGLTSTLMVGERTNGPFRRGALHGNHFNYETTWMAAVRDWDERDDDHGHMAMFQSGHVPNDVHSDDRDVSAPHVGYANFALGDGSVRGITENIDFKLYQSLSSHNMGEVVGEF